MGVSCLRWLFYFVSGFCLICLDAQGNDLQHCPAESSLCGDENSSSPLLKDVKAALNIKDEFCDPHNSSNCFYYNSQIRHDLLPFQQGIARDVIEDARSQGVTYKLIDHQLYREKTCMFPARCEGVEYFLLRLAAELPDLEFVLNDYDWPRVHVNTRRKAKVETSPLPVFSFSKTLDYHDIIYPAWSFWAGGPAISLYPKGIGRWNQLREQITESSKEFPWEKKKSIGFFRGSRTTGVRDSLVLLSRSEPELVDAQYTKNQAWKSEKDTLGRPPAPEVSFEHHCQYKYLFNFRGVAASFRFRHLFLCGSLVIHVGQEWIEFFYGALKPWVHYIPLKENPTEREIKDMLNYVRNHDEEARAIAEQGRRFILEHLRMEDVQEYWRRLLVAYAPLLKYSVARNETYKLIS